MINIGAINHYNSGVRVGVGVRAGVRVRVGLGLGLELGLGLINVGAQLQTLADPQASPQKTSPLPK